MRGYTFGRLDSTSLLILRVRRENLYGVHVHRIVPTEKRMNIGADVSALSNPPKAIEIELALRFLKLKLKCSNKCVCEGRDTAGQDELRRIHPNTIDPTPYARKPERM